MSTPDNAPFMYDRGRPPLFFSDPTYAEKSHWETSLRKIPREYYRLVRQYPDLDAATPMSNGMTAGEFGMWSIVKSNKRRETVDSSDN